MIYIYIYIIFVLFLQHIKIKMQKEKNDKKIAKTLQTKIISCIPGHLFQIFLVAIVSRIYQNILMCISNSFPIPVTKVLEY